MCIHKAVFSCLEYESAEHFLFLLISLFVFKNNFDSLWYLLHLAIGVGNFLLTCMANMVVDCWYTSWLFQDVALCGDRANKSPFAWPLQGHWHSDAGHAAWISPEALGWPLHWGFCHWKLLPTGWPPTFFRGGSGWDGVGERKLHKDYESVWCSSGCEIMHGNI